uniref:Putative secreted protein n=1 Tax=Anopheles darlingi TaxID=43151 RepID=A0A2M4DF82_ANODA
MARPRGLYFCICLFWANIIEPSHSISIRSSSQSTSHAQCYITEAVAQTDVCPCVCECGFWFCFYCHPNVWIWWWRHERHDGRWLLIRLFRT